MKFYKESHILYANIYEVYYDLSTQKSSKSFIASSYANKCLKFHDSMILDKILKMQNYNAFLYNNWIKE